MHYLIKFWMHTMKYKEFEGIEFVFVIILGVLSKI